MNSSEFQRQTMLKGKISIFSDKNAVRKSHAEKF
jgi:hypothetical protein